jgi:hypothetical protein
MSSFGPRVLNLADIIGILADYLRKLAESGVVDSAKKGNLKVFGGYN